MITDLKPVLELESVSKFFGSVVALEDISISVHAAEVVCLLGDNGAGKSTLIKILSGVFTPDAGRYLVDHVEAHFTSPRDALARGIATVYQDLAVIPLNEYRAEFLGWGPFRRVRKSFVSRVVREELVKLGINLQDTSRPVGTLSGGQRQAVAIARAIYLGARVLILDEATSSLGIKEASLVLRFIAKAKSSGLGIIFVTHNVQHACQIGDRFAILNRGKSCRIFAKSEISRDQVMSMMAGGTETELTK